VKRSRIETHYLLVRANAEITNMYEVNMCEELRNPIDLPFEVQPQLESEWCWAAVSTSVAKYYTPSTTVTQCAVVNQQLGRSDCCSNPGSNNCNQPGYLDQALQFVGNFASETGPVSFDDVVLVLDWGTPPCIRIGWSGGGGHFIGVQGCQPNGFLLVTDPIYGDSIVTYDTLTTGMYQGNGIWTTTYCTQASGPINIGGNTTASTPFVASDGWVYFQGTDNKLWKVKNDGTGQEQIGGNTTASAPFVTRDGWVWFRGTDDKLWKVFNDGTQQSQPGNNTTSSSPRVLGCKVYFQGTDNKLWCMTTDGSAQVNVGGNTTASTPWGESNSIYFRGTDQTLWRYFTRFPR
jgi:Domain of unknown function (DUF5050)/Papain-like cysteine protease AvrRpt2